MCDPIVKNPFLVPSAAQGTVVERGQQDGEFEDVNLRQAIMEVARKFQPLVALSPKRHRL